MRLLLYNIRYGTGGHWIFPWRGYLGPTQRKLGEIIRFIESVNPDVMGLIEVDNGSYRSGRSCQAEQIAAALGHYHTYHSKYQADSFLQRLPILNLQGNAFLTRDTIHGEKLHFFERGVKRLVLELELRDVAIFLVHLSLHYRTRQGQLNELHALVKQSVKPVIVAGDFNARWGHREMYLFQEATGLVSADPGHSPSYPSRQPSKQLDFVLHSPSIRTLGFSIPSVTLSDHLPLVFDFEV